MDRKLETAEKKVLAEIVKLVQKRGLEGTQGGWKEFLKTYDKKFGASLSDPSKRSNDVLVSFLKTFTKDDDLELFSRVLQSHLNRNRVEQFSKLSRDNETTEQSLVRLTLEHPQYLIDYAFPIVEEGWIVIKTPKKSRALKSNAMIAVDCEMVLCDDGTEALVRVCAVDRDLQVKINELIKPNKAVADYRTEITGVAAGDLDGVTCSVADIQKSLKKLLSNGTILVGHGLHNDLQVLKIDHARVIDTSYIFKYLDATIHRKPSLNNLCKSVLGYEVRKPGAAHNCLDDACAAMKLVLAKLERGEITLVPDVSQPEREKLLLHRIPVYVHREEISKVIPGAVAIEVKVDYTLPVSGFPFRNPWLSFSLPWIAASLFLEALSTSSTLIVAEFQIWKIVCRQPTKKLQGRHYSAIAVFNSPQEANQAYENMEGDEEKASTNCRSFFFLSQDSHGLPQKLVSFQFGDGSTASLYIRKMAQEDSHREVLSNKRAFEGEEKLIESKKLKTDEKTVENVMEDNSELDDHLKEIERLKQELQEKDAKIVLQDKMISNLLKKVEEMKKVLNKRK
ncbi:small RNA degrading nuclease 1-like [Gossypium australe]|uniref:Small RNA degrading nuclease 1-like n=1 Tax=Gossypium australe TaxID=47621 RepID=A0A5B6VV54_9ROSI|nr:small RNA degrading nuclease 1-like [Gossypium australe]